MDEKLSRAIEALNDLITDNDLSNRPRVITKLTTWKRYLLGLQRVEN